MKSLFGLVLAALVFAIPAAYSCEIDPRIIRFVGAEQLSTVVCAQGKVFYPNGSYAGTPGGRWFHPNGAFAGQKNRIWFHQNGNHAGSEGGGWYHSNGAFAGIVGGSWFDKN